MFLKLSRQSRRFTQLSNISFATAAAQLDRVQPFFDAAQSVSSVPRSQPFFEAAISTPYHDPSTIRRVVIEPQFSHEEQFVMDSERFTIDCSQYENISVDNEALTKEIKSKWNDVGLVYITNTGLTNMQDMRQLAKLVLTHEMEYKGGSNWRNNIEPNVYDTGAPKEAWIHYHHEMAYVGLSPEYLGFCAQNTLPDGRGATYVSDQVQATKDLLNTEFGQKLKEKGICYIRCLTDEEFYRDQEQSEFDVYNHWQKSFGTNDPDTAVENAKERGLKVEWDMDHPRYGRYMKTKFYTDVYEYCPAIDKNLLFASVADHAMWFDSWPGLCMLPNDERPLKITYGDDTEFTEDELKQFVDIYDKYGIPINWKQGDIAVMCNWRWAHGRPQYSLNSSEEKRDLGVILGQVFERTGQKTGKWY